MEHINDILAKHFSSTPLSSQEQETIDTWKLENKAEFSALEKSWNAVPEFEFKQFDSKTAWHTIDSKIEETKPKQTKTFSIKPILKYAVAASVALILAIGGFNYFKNSEAEFIAFENTSNAPKSVTLEDGSTIHLAQNSTIQYQEDFKNNRNIILDGEAFFDVNRDESHPFIISTDYGFIEVLGTSFNINTKNNSTEVNVKSGLVELRNKLTKIKLTKDETAISNGTTITPIVPNEINYLAWQTGEFVFDNITIQSAVKQLNKFYTTQIVISDSVNQMCYVTGTFNNQKIEDVVDAITLSCNLVSEKENNQIIIK